MKHTAFAFLLFAALGARADTGPTVANAFPQSLVASGSLREYAFATGVAHGRSIIAAAYSNGEFGAVAVLTPAGRVIATIAPDNLVGTRPEVTLRDIDGDGQPEIVVVMNQSRGLPTTWIYRFANERLTLLGPLLQGAELPETDLGEVEFLPPDSAGRVAVLDRHTARWSDDDGTEHTSETRTLYTPAGPLDSVVAAHYPHFLAEQATLHKYGDHREQTYVELTAKGTGYLVAAYSNRENGAVVLLQKTGDFYRVDTEISRESGLIIVGKQPELTARDIDGDGVPEIVATFSDNFNNRPASWVFRVTDDHLQLISPTEEDGGTVLGEPQFLDLNGKGTLDMIDNVVVSRTRDDVKVEQEHYALRDGKYVALEPVDYYETFYTGGKTVTRTFSVPRASLRKAARLILVNGDELGAPYRVDTGTVTLNGVTVSVQQGTRAARVKLKRRNILTVSLHGGKHGARVAVVVRHD